VRVSEPARVLQRAVRQALREGDTGEARRALARLRRLDAVGIGTRMLELELAIAERRWNEARAGADLMLERFPRSARAHYLAGREAYLVKDYARAEPLLRESLALESTGWAQRYLGKTLTQVGCFDEAEAILVELAPRQPWCKLDLAWLYERQERTDRARAMLESYLAEHPDHAHARRQLRRLRRIDLDADTAIEEAEALLALGEELPLDLLSSYLRALLGHGRRDDAATLVAERLSAFDPRQACQLGWACRELQAPDLALELFLRGFDHGVRDFKFLTALETVASLCRRSAELIPLYEEHAPRRKNLYGRLHKVRARADGEG